MNNPSSVAIPAAVRFLVSTIVNSQISTASAPAMIAFASAITETRSTWALVAAIAAWKSANQW